jgi:hypothetical protein
MKDMKERKSLFNKIHNFFDNLIVKYHHCENYLELYSILNEKKGGIIICQKIEYKCAICDKVGRRNDF